MVSETLREVTASLEDGEYLVVSTLKEGRLYLAEKAGKRFLLKTASGAKGLEQLKREYELSIGLSHPGLAYVFTYEEDSPVGPCLVQEYVDGETLTLWLAGNPSSRERRRVCSELLAVMAYLHQKGVVHNDLKPDNILISKASGAVKLIDLGFADDDTHLWKALGGTRRYASPELLERLFTSLYSEDELNLIYQEEDHICENLSMKKSWIKVSKLVVSGVTDKEMVLVHLLWFQAIANVNVYLGREYFQSNAIE